MKLFLLTATLMMGTSALAQQTTNMVLWPQPL